MLCFQDQNDLTSSPTQATSQVVSSAQRQDSDWRSWLKVFPVCNHTEISAISEPLKEIDEFLHYYKTPIASRSQPTVPSPPHAKILYSCRLRKKCSLGKKRQWWTLKRVRQYVTSGEPYPGAGPPFDRLYTWRGFSRNWNFLSTLQRNTETDEKVCSWETVPTPLMKPGTFRLAFLHSLGWQIPVEGGSLQLEQSDRRMRDISRIVRVKTPSKGIILMTYCNFKNQKSSDLEWDGDTRPAGHGHQKWCSTGWRPPPISKRETVTS